MHIIDSMRSQIFVLLSAGSDRELQSLGVTCMRLCSKKYGRNLPTRIGKNMGEKTRATPVSGSADCTFSQL